MKPKIMLFFLALFLLLSSPKGSLIFSASAQQELTPEWTYSDGGDFYEVAISADGKYIAAGTRDTGRLYLFEGNVSLWNTLVGAVSRIKMSSDGKYILVQAGSNHYIFDRASSSPLLSYSAPTNLDISSNGKYLVTSRGLADKKVEFYELGQSYPNWTYDGVGGGVYMSRSGDYFMVRSGANMIYVFSREQEQLLWSYTFEVKFPQGGVRISGNDRYIIIAGGDQGDGTDCKLLQFSTQSSSPLWQTKIGFLVSELSISYNGSIMAVAPVNFYTKPASGALIENPLIVFDKNVRHSVVFGAGSSALAMSSDGRYISIGGSNGVYIVEYSQGSLTLKSKYTKDSPYIFDIDSSSDGRYVAAVGMSRESNSYSYSLYFFDTFREVTAFNPLGQWLLFIGVAVAGGSVATITFFIWRKRASRRRLSQ